MLKQQKDTHFTIRCTTKAATAFWSLTIHLHVTPLKYKRDDPVKSEVRNVGVVR